MALAIRRALAAMLDVHAEHVHADDRIPQDLGDLFVRESLDAVEFVLNLEEELRVRIEDGAVGELLTRECLSVHELCAGLWRSAKPA
jgi:acyl carrier protein